MNQTKIEWCDATVNPVMGCTKGCAYCYTRRLNQRFKWIKKFLGAAVFSGAIDAAFYEKTEAYLHEFHERYCGLEARVDERNTEHDT